MASLRFYSDITKSIYLINKHLDQLENKKSCQNQFHLGHIIASLLIKSSLVLNNADHYKKHHLHTPLLLLLKRLYIETTLSLPYDKRFEFAENIETLIQETAFIFDLNYHQYGCLFRLNRFWMIVGATNSTSTGMQKSFVFNEKNPCLVWNGRNNGSFDKFLKIISKYDISSVHNFKKMFKNSSHDIRIALNESNPDFVLQFLCCLKESKLVSYHNSTGFYQVFRSRVNKFDPVFLKNKKPQRKGRHSKKTCHLVHQQTQV